MAQVGGWRPSQRSQLLSTRAGGAGVFLDPVGSRDSHVLRAAVFLSGHRMIAPSGVFMLAGQRNGLHAPAARHVVVDGPGVCWSLHLRFIATCGGCVCRAAAEGCKAAAA